jgi:hypothetical protein
MACSQVLLLICSATLQISTMLAPEVLEALEVLKVLMLAVQVLAHSGTRWAAQILPAYQLMRLSVVAPALGAGVRSGTRWAATLALQMQLLVQLAAVLGIRVEMMTALFSSRGPYPARTTTTTTTRTAVLVAMAVRVRVRVDLSLDSKTILRAATV